MNLTVNEKLNTIKMNWEQLHMNVDDGDWLIAEAEEMQLVKKFLATLRNSKRKSGKLYIGEYVYNIAYACRKDELD